MPETLDKFKRSFPDTWVAYHGLREVCDREGPLDTKTVELIKIGMSTAMEHEGGVVAHVARARKAGADDKEIYHAILLATSLAGFPAALRAVTAAQAYLEK